MHAAIAHTLLLARQRVGRPAALQSHLQFRLVFTAAMREQLEARVSRHTGLLDLLPQPGLDSKLIAKYSRELSALEKVVGTIHEYQDAVRAADELVELAQEAHADPELVKMARDELVEARETVTALEGRLTKLLVPIDEADTRDAILELRAGTGGDEAGIFTAEMLALYEGYAQTKGWAWSIISVSRGEVGDGVKDAVVSVKGEGAYGRLKHEAGVHRVQRVPLTEAGGRVHTSTMAVVVLPEAEEVDFELKPSDLRIDTYRAGGAGGQHVNTTDSAVRITHIPTGVVVAIQDERSQHMNKSKALLVLRSRLFARDREMKDQERQKARRGQVGRGDRSERIRTYNFNQNRVTDHRVNVTVHNTGAMMRGEALDEFTDALQEAADTAALAALEEGGGA